MILTCENCGKALNWADWYYKKNDRNEKIKAGDIWTCMNNNCLNHWFYTITEYPGELFEGYPC